MCELSIIDKTKELKLTQEDLREKETVIFKYGSVEGTCVINRVETEITSVDIHMGDRYLSFDKDTDTFKTNFLKIDFECLNKCKELLDLDIPIEKMIKSEGK